MFGRETFARGRLVACSLSALSAFFFSYRHEENWSYHRHSRDCLRGSTGIDHSAPPTMMRTTCFPNGNSVAHLAEQPQFNSNFTLPECPLLPALRPDPL